jgi:hypothetical protein
MKFSTLISLLCLEASLGFAPGATSREGGGFSFALQATTQNRRSALATLLSTTAVTLAGLPQAASAKDEIFKPNPLTNAVFEQIRIWDQDSADNLKYDGELEKGDAGNKGKVEAYPGLLVPIVKMSNDINKVNELVNDNGDSKQESYKTARDILSQSKFTKIEFKKMFNAYGDNIYYSDPDRANLYSLGGATPKSEQSMAYLLRNDLLGNIENLTAEVDFLLKPQSVADNESTDDLLMYGKACKTAMDKYLTLAPPNEMKLALEMIDST